MVKEKIIKLKYPFQFDNKELGIVQDVSEIKLTRLKAKHLKKIPSKFFNEGKGEAAELLPLIADLSGYPLEAIDELDAVDFTEVIGGLQDFLS